MKITSIRKAGFTLVEIMIVVAIIGLLAAIAIPNFVKARQASRKNACIANLKQMEGAKATWALETKALIGATPVLSDLIGTDKYIRVMPSCPAGGGDYMASIGTVVQTPTCTLLATPHWHTL